MSVAYGIDTRPHRIRQTDRVGFSCGAARDVRIFVDGRPRICDTLNMAETDNAYRLMVEVAKDAKHADADTKACLLDIAHDLLVTARAAELHQDWRDFSETCSAAEAALLGDFSWR